MNLRIEDIARRLIEALPPGVHGVREDLEANFRAVLRANLSRLDLLSRDEFLVQAKVLERTREELDRLETRLAELEARLSEGSQSPDQTDRPTHHP